MQLFLNHCNHLKIGLQSEWSRDEVHYSEMQRENEYNLHLFIFHLNLSEGTGITALQQDNFA